MTETLAAGRSREELLTAVAEAVEAVPGVAGLNGGPFGEIATYLPGRRVAGLRLRAADAAPDAHAATGGTDKGTTGGVEVHVALNVGAPIRETAAAVRAAASALVPGPVDVIVEDIVEKAVEKTNEGEGTRPTALGASEATTTSGST